MLREGASRDGHVLSGRGTNGGGAADNGTHRASEDSHSELDSEYGSDSEEEEQQARP